MLKMNPPIKAYVKYYCEALAVMALMFFFFIALDAGAKTYLTKDTCNFENPLN